VGVGTGSALSAAMAHALSRSSSLEALMERYVGGDDAAFEELYSAALPRVRTAVSRWTRDAEQVEDVLQATFLKLHRSKDTYALGEPLLPWLFVIAKRTLMDERRPLRYRFEVLASEDTLQAEALPVEHREEQLGLQVREALTQIPEQYRDAIAMTKLAGFSGNEAARVLNTTKAAIKQRVHRGYALLRELFEQGMDNTTPATA
jgi:RNA polymerase sigma factor (sigma-70 family)